MSRRCTVTIPAACANIKAAATGIPVTLEVVTDDGVAFSLTFARGAWTHLLTGGRDVEAEMAALGAREVA